MQNKKHIILTLNFKNMKTIKLIYKISIILILGVLLTACPKTELKEIKIDQESKDYCLFAEGSYWIYQDSATLEIDSVIINYPIDYMFTRSSENGYKCEQYRLGISSCSHDSIASFDARLTTYHADHHLLKPCLLTGDRGTIYHNGEIREIVPGKANVRSTILLEKKSNYLINEIKYSNIKIFRYEYLEEKRNYYWAKHVGLIRAEIYKNESLISVRSLIRYNVKPYNQ